MAIRYQHKTLCVIKVRESSQNLCALFLQAWSHFDIVGKGTTLAQHILKLHGLI